MGRPAHRAEPDQAALAIAGYTVVNDISMRDWQHRTSQALQGKTFDRTTPPRPVLVSPDEVDHAHDLAIGCDVDGQSRQRGSTHDLLFTPADRVSYAGQFLTLLPGDLILTGTPSGTGEPTADHLRPGQTSHTWIDGIGECRNTITHDDNSTATTR